MPFRFSPLSIPEVILIEPKIFPDERGIFFENFKKSDFSFNGIDTKFLQDNFSQSKKNVIRGLHFQIPPKAQAKFVSALKGEILDIAVDIRKNSLTYGKWISQILSENNHKSLYIPEGFAHGFCVLSEEASVLYKVSQEFSLEHDRGINWSDPDLKISWPVEKPIISKKDSGLPFLKNIDSYFEY